MLNAQKPYALALNWNLCVEGQTCFTCGRTAKPNVCGNCFYATYCDAKCQKLDWIQHLYECEFIRKETALGQFRTNRFPGLKAFKNRELRLALRVISSCCKKHSNTSIIAKDVNLPKNATKEVPRSLEQLAHELSMTPPMENPTHRLYNIVFEEFVRSFRTCFQHLYDTLANLSNDDLWFVHSLIREKSVQLHYLSSQDRSNYGTAIYTSIARLRHSCETPALMIPSKRFPSEIVVKYLNTEIRTPPNPRQPGNSQPKPEPETNRVCETTTTQQPTTFNFAYNPLPRFICEYHGRSAAVHPVMTTKQRRLALEQRVGWDRICQCDLCMDADEDAYRCRSLSRQCSSCSFPLVLSHLQRNPTARCLRCRSESSNMVEDWFLKAAARLLRTLEAVSTSAPDIATLLAVVSDAERYLHSVRNVTLLQSREHLYYRARAVLTLSRFVTGDLRLQLAEVIPQLRNQIIDSYHHYGVTIALADFLEQSAREYLDSGSSEEGHLNSTELASSHIRWESRESQRRAGNATPDTRPPGPSTLREITPRDPTLELQEAAAIWESLLEGKHEEIPAILREGLDLTQLSDFLEDEDDELTAVSE